MNKRLLIVLALIPALLVAGERDVEQARAIAQQFVASQSIAHRAPGKARVKCVYTQTMPNLEREAFYVFNNGEKGFVMVSAETNTPDIIGYSDETMFAAQKLPDHIQGWFNYYAQQIEWLAQHPEEQAYSPSTTYTPVEPLLQKIEWGQLEPFNYFCPIMPDETERSATGCVATAMAQIMAYHQWPKHSKGKHSLPYDRSIILDYDKDGKYDWDIMHYGNYSSDHTTPEQDTAVAKLMWHLGVACDMQYSSAGSGADESEMIRRSMLHFDYDSSAQIYSLDYMPTDTFVNLIYKQLILKQPCLISGVTDRMEGHAFVGDGIDEEGKVHINWGWEGMYNGYFYVTLLDPVRHGTGGSASGLGFTNYVNVCINIKPNAHGKPTPNSVMLERINCENDTLVIGREDLLATALVGVYTMGVWNYYEGVYGTGIYQDGQFKGWLNKISIKDEEREDTTRICGYFPQTLPNGKYELYPASQAKGSSEVLRAFAYTPYPIDLEVTDEQILINGGVELRISNLKGDSEDFSAFFQWESPAPYFNVELSSDLGVLIDTIIDKPEFRFEVDSVGIYTLTIFPLHKKEKSFVWPGSRVRFLLYRVCYITNLQCTGEDMTATISWESDAPKCNLELKKGKKKIANSFFSEQSCTFTGEEGTYTVTVTPYDISEKYAIGDPQTIEFQLPFQSDDIPNLFFRQPLPKRLEGQQVIVNINDKRYTILGNEQH